MTGPEDILATYDRVAARYRRERDVSLFEEGWLRRLLAAAPGLRVLDLGCGPGRPIAAWMVAQGCRVTGVDGAPGMIAQFRQSVPEAEAILADMRGLALGRDFDAILAWNSFFHLSRADQSAMIPVFAAHAAPGAALMFTSGPADGEAWGKAGGAPVYHASLSPRTYRDALAKAGFEMLAFVPEDPECRGHTVWLARRPGAD